jgi:uncharacterized protein (DUF433 family)
MSGITYTIENNVITSTSYTSGSTDLVIPDTVTSIGSYAFNNVSNVLTSVIIPDSVTSIGGYAFQQCTKLTSIIIPNSVTNIGEAAFYRCTSLTDITISTGITSIGFYVFQECSSLTSVNIPNSVTSISLQAFQDCSKLTSVTIPNSVTTIGVSAFRECTALTSIIIPKSVTLIDWWAFFNCSSLKNIILQRKLSDGSLTILGYNCFYGTGISFTNYGPVLEMLNDGYTVNQLINTTDGPGIHEDITSRSNAVSNFLRLSENKTIITSINFDTYLNGMPLFIPSTVLTIGPDAFLNMPNNSFTSVTFIGSGITTISSGAFKNCNNLTSIVFPSSVTTIGESAFQNCNNLTSIELQRSSTQGLTTLGANCFLDAGLTVQSVLTMYNMGYSKVELLDSGISVSILLEAIPNLDIPNVGIQIVVTNGVLTSSSYTSGSTVLVIPETVTSIGAGAFNITSIKTVLTSVTIPNTVTSIGASAFQGCSLLTSLTLQRTSTQGLTTLGSNCFLNTGLTVTSILTIYNQGYTRYNLITSGFPTNIVDETIATQDGEVIITVYYHNADYFG